MHHNCRILVKRPTGGQGGGGSNVKPAAVAAAEEDVADLRIAAAFGAGVAYIKACAGGQQQLKPTLSGLLLAASLQQVLPPGQPMQAPHGGEVFSYEGECRQVNKVKENALASMQPSGGPTEKPAGTNGELVWASKASKAIGKKGHAEATAPAERRETKNFGQSAFKRGPPPTSVPVPPRWAGEGDALQLGLQKRTVPPVLAALLPGLLQQGVP